MRVFRNIVDVMLPPQAQNDGGEQEGDAVVFRAGVPCQIETITAGEAERVHATWPSATVKVELYADSKRVVTPNMYLLVRSQPDRPRIDGTTGPRILNIVGVIDKAENGLMNVLFCDEAV